MTYLIVMANVTQPRSWEWEFAGIAAAGVVLANVLLIAVVHIGRLRRYGAVGMLSLPYTIAFEIVGPVLPR